MAVTGLLVMMTVTRLLVMMAASKIQVATITPTIYNPHCNTRSFTSTTYTRSITPTTYNPHCNTFRSKERWQTKKQNNNGTVEQLEFGFNKDYI